MKNYISIEQAEGLRARFGDRHQFKKSIEELEELLFHLRQFDSKKLNVNSDKRVAIADEIIDCFFTLEQLIDILEISKVEFSYLYKKKTDLIKRILGEK